MRIDTLRFKGVTCFTDEVALDFREIPPGLIAIVGPNGAGKTTLMETMPAGIYRQMPTRGPIVKYATGKDSFVDIGLTFDEAGSFRARLNLDGVTPASDAVLERVVNGLSTRLNDGKVTTFDTAVKGIFPPLDALLASAFAAQNRAGSFATRNKTERKDLFYTLLGLHRLDGFATTCRAAVTLIEKRLAELRGRRDAIAGDASDDALGQLQTQAAALEADLAAAVHEVRGLAELVGNFDQAVLTSYRVDVQRLAATMTRRHGLEAAQVEQQTQRTQASADLAAVDRDETRDVIAATSRTALAISSHNSRLAQLATDAEILGDQQRELDRIAVALDALRTDKRGRIDRNNGMKDRAGAIRVAAAAVASGRAAQEAQERDRDARALALEGTVAIVAAAERALEAVDTLIAERARIARTANLLLDVPCGGGGEFAACQFLLDAKVADARLTELAALRLDAQRETADQHLVECRAVVAAEREALDALRREIAQRSGVIVANQADSDLLPFLEVAEDRIAELEAAITAAETKATTDQEAARAAARNRMATRDADRLALTEALATVRTTGTHELEEVRTRYADLRQQRTQRVTDLDASLATIAAELATTAGAAADHAAAEAALAAALQRREASQQQLSDARTAQARLDEQVAIVRTRLADAQAKREQCDQLTATITALETELIEWQALALVMGRDGLPVLEIDAAGPGVSAEANDLLQASFSGRFVVELVTQEAKADGKGMKEVFELKVYDHERGGEERDLSDLSGGEQVVVDEALKSAIALFVNRRNDRPIRTVWRDETTGALDPENALRYVAMLRRLHERAGLHHLFFVSHNPDVSAQADVQLQVGDGRVTVAYPPFAPSPASQAAA